MLLIAPTLLRTGDWAWEKSAAFPAVVQKLEEQLRRKFNLDSRAATMKTGNFLTLPLNFKSLKKFGTAGSKVMAKTNIVVPRFV